MTTDFLRSRGRAIAIACALALALGTSLAVPSSADTTFGKLTGIVVDPSGTPQMGATVVLMTEGLQSVSSYRLDLFTNQHGGFSNSRIPAGFYELHVTLAGFLPKVEHHVRIVPNVTTLVKVELATIFASLDRLRQGPDKPSSPDDWKWVLRTSAASRPVLQWTNPGLSAQTADDYGRPASRGQVKLTSGSNRPGSISNMPDAPTTAVSYDQNAGNFGHILFAGELNYGGALPAYALATSWAPAGNNPDGPVTEVTLRQATLGPGGLIFRGERISQRETIAIGQHATLRVGAEAVSAQLGESTKALRPSAAIDVVLPAGFQGTLIVFSGTASSPILSPSPETSAMAALDGFPILMVRNGRPVLEGGWHEEAGVGHSVTRRGSIEVAGFHERNGDTPIFGRGNVSNPEYLQDPFSSAFVYDAGPTSTWGIRAIYKEQLTQSLDLAVIYAYAGALAPGEMMDAADQPLREELQMQYRHSVAARLSGKVHRTGTQFSASYKWLSGEALSQQDAIGEAFAGIDPYLSISIRQPMPGTIGGCHWEALADFRNLLAQGYFFANSKDGQVLLVPASRAVRGGISVRF
ncbi:MAG TPA: carboxypeptidase-like regulatory domain-containing protein [Candidatus Acidoferrum sp.]|nr:carboxypeptidase-like regulatory domain-containing protein [Candidatus Acidoferrum sp.]